ncbi:unnamed protein product, partial [Discosporangium mesarthrocarpum]
HLAIWTGNEANNFDLEPTSSICRLPSLSSLWKIFTENGYRGSAADIWSLGVILYATLAGFLSF